MATSGYGNRLAGGNRFFQGPLGPGWRLARGRPRGCAAPRSPHLLGEAQRPSPTWNYRLPRLPPATAPQGEAQLPASAPHAAPPIPEWLSG